MMGEYAVKSAAGEWLVFRVSEDYARKVYWKTQEGSLWKVEGRELRTTLIESRQALPAAA